MNIVITGGIGCGKSTAVIGLMEEFPNFETYDMDLMVHDLYHNPKFVEFLQQTFGTKDRAEISNLVFADSNLKRLLENESMKYLIPQLHIALASSNIIIECPLFYEMGLKQTAAESTVIAIVCDKETQMTRVQNRNKFSIDKINNIINSQFSSELKQSLADHVIDTTNGDIGPRVLEIADKIKTAFLRSRCIDFFGSNVMWDHIEKAYSEPHRHYHTLLHISRMFQWFDSFPKNKYSPVIELAIWMHDYVYDTNDHYTHNESRSVAAMAKLCREHSPSMLQSIDNYSMLGLASEFVLATKSHKITSSFILAHDAVKQACEFFLDLDLIILGASNQVVNDFDEAIRCEFSQYDLATFASGRVSVLRNLNDRESLFLTPDIKTEVEHSARRNLANLIGKWEKHAI